MLVIEKVGMGYYSHSLNGAPHYTPILSDAMGFASELDAHSAAVAAQLGWNVSVYPVPAPYGF